MKICVVGAGYVGLVSAAILADWQHNVVCVDHNEQKIEDLLAGKLPIFEPGLQELVELNRRRQYLRFTAEMAEALRGCEMIIVAVGTPPAENGHPNLEDFWAVVKSFRENVGNNVIVMIKSTVPVGTGEAVSLYLNEKVSHTFSVVSAPEFLRQGTAVHDFLHPDRLVVGCMSPEIREQMKELFQPLDCPKVFTDWHSAEMIKYASNSFLALKISYINTIANLCEAVGGNIQDVAAAVGLDHRIGQAYLKPGVGFGGSCLAKDTQGLIAQGEVHGVNVWMFKDVLEVNYEQRVHIVQRLTEVLGNLKGRKIAILGLAFKANTDDLRDAPSVTIIAQIIKLGGLVKVYDPVVDSSSLPDAISVSTADNPYTACQGVDAVIVLTEWEEFLDLDLKRLQKSMNAPVFIDGRYLFERKRLLEAGFFLPERPSSSEWPVVQSMISAR